MSVNTDDFDPSLWSLSETIVRLRRERNDARAEVEQLNQMLRETGYGQGQIDAYAAQCEEIERLRTQCSMAEPLSEKTMLEDCRCPLCGSSHTHLVENAGYPRVELPFRRQECQNAGCALPCRFWDQIGGLKREVDWLRGVLRPTTITREPFAVGED